MLLKHTKTGNNPIKIPLFACHRGTLNCSKDEVKEMTASKEAILFASAGGATGFSVS